MLEFVSGEKLVGTELKFVAAPAIAYAGLGQTGLAPVASIPNHSMWC